MSPGVNVGRHGRNSISTLTGIELLGNIVWYRTKAKIKKISESYHPKTSPSRPYAKELPQELVEMIIAHILLDTQTLKAFSATCRSWYIVALPHLHHTLTLRQWASDPAHRGLKPLRKLDKMQLLPFVIRLRMVLEHVGFVPVVINARSPVYFSTLLNVQELSISMLDFRGFAPQMKLCFAHFAPKLRTLALDHPRGTRRDLLSFIGFFPKLDNLKLEFDRTDMELPWQLPVLRPAPSMRGRLTLRSFFGEGFLRDLSEMCGGLRFHSVDLDGLRGARLLLDACAKTLETLRVIPDFWSGNRTTPRRKFDLSKCRSLRSLEITGENTETCFHAEDLFPTITSSVFSEVVIVLEDGDMRDWRLFRCELFNAVRDMYEVKPFRLVFSLEIWEGDRERATEWLKRCIDVEAVEGRLAFLPCPPVIVFNTRAALNQFA